MKLTRAALRKMIIEVITEPEGPLNKNARPAPSDIQLPRAAKMELEYLSGHSFRDFKLAVTDDPGMGDYGVSDEIISAMYMKTGEEWLYDSGAQEWSQV